MYGRRCFQPRTVGHGLSGWTPRTPHGDTTGRLRVWKQNNPLQDSQGTDELVQHAHLVLHSNHGCVRGGQVVQQASCIRCSGCPFFSRGGNATSWQARGCGWWRGCASGRRGSSSGSSSGISLVAEIARSQNDMQHSRCILWVGLDCQGADERHCLRLDLGDDVSHNAAMSSLLDRDQVAERVGRLVSACSKLTDSGLEYNPSNGPGAMLALGVKGFCTRLAGKHQQ